MSRITTIIIIMILSILFMSCDILDSVNTSDAALELYGDNPYDIYDGTANGCDGNDDGILSQGEKARIKIRVTNSGKEKADDVKLTITTNDDYVSVVSGEIQTIGDMEAYNTFSTPDANTTGSILLRVAQGTPNGHIVDFKVEFRDDLRNRWTEEFSMVVEPIGASILLYGDNPYKVYDGTANGANGNDNDRVEPGETARLKLRVKNEGNSDALQVTMVARIEDSYVTIIDDSTYTFGDISAWETLATSDANTNSALLISADSTTPSGHLATITLYFTDKFENQWSDNFQVIIQ